MSGIIKHNLKIIFLIVVAVSFLAVVYAQDRSQYTKEQIQEQISQEKQLIRELAKMFLVDALPELVKEDPTLAEQALVKYVLAIWKRGDKMPTTFILRMVKAKGHYFPAIWASVRVVIPSHM